MPSNTEAELQARITEFARDIANILQRAVADSAGSAGAANGGRRGRNGSATDSAPSRGGKKAGKKAGKRGKGGRRAAARGPSDEAVLKEVKKEGGRRITLIAEAMGVQSADIVKQLKRLVADKKVKTAGQRRGTTYKAA